MLKTLFTYLPVTTIIIIYLYLCGTLYLIGFWSTFDIDISNLVGLADIPKSFIYPFILSNLLFLIQVVVSEMTSKEVAKGAFVPTPYNWRKFIIDMILYAGAILVATQYSNHKYSTGYWSIACLFFLLLLAYKFGRAPLVNKYLPSHNLKYYTGTIIITVPIFCILTAKLASISIYNNSDIKYAKIMSNDNNRSINDTLSFKLLGFLGDKFIISSLDNKKIQVLNQSSFDGVELIKKEDQKK